MCQRECNFCRKCECEKEFRCIQKELCEINKKLECIEKGVFENNKKLNCIEEILCKILRELEKTEKEDCDFECKHDECEDEKKEKCFEIEKENIMKLFEGLG